MRRTVDCGPYGCAIPGAAVVHERPSARDCCGATRYSEARIQPGVVACGGRHDSPFDRCPAPVSATARRNAGTVARRGLRRAHPRPRSASPELQLLGAAELAIPRGCEATPGAVYRTYFKVQPDGRVSDAASESGNGCVQQALRTWVTTFSYAPLREATPVAFDWMIVTAARND